MQVSTRETATVFFQLSFDDIVSPDEPNAKRKQELDDAYAIVQQIDRLVRQLKCFPCNASRHDLVHMLHAIICQLLTVLQMEQETGLA